MPKAYSYIRFSTPEQAKGDSLRRQLEGARQYCAEHGLELDDSLRDLGRSAYRGGHTNKKNALGRFLKLVEEGQVPRGSYLIVESLDRLSREEVIDAAMRLLALIDAGITVVTLSDRQAYSRGNVRDNWTLLLLSLSVMARAHEESKIKSERVGKAWAQKRVLAQETGQAMSSICPGWIRLVGGPRRGRYELIPERAAIVKRIFEDAVAGLGRRSIARSLNEEGVPTWGVGKKKGGIWHDSYVQKVLRNPAAYGIFEPLSKRAGGDGTSNIRLDGYYPPAIDEDLFFAAQAATTSRVEREGRPAAGHRNLLRGLAKCGGCGANLIIIDKGQRSSGPKLICSRAHAAAGCTDRTYYGYAPLELGVLAAVSDRLDSLVLSSRDRAAEIRMRRDAAIARRAERQVRLDNLIELVAGGAKSSTLAGQVTGLQSEIDAASIDIKTLDAEVRAAEGADRDDPAAGFMELQRQLRDTEGDEHVRVRAAIAQRLRGLVERIVVAKAEAIVHLADGGEGYVTGF